MKHFAAAVILCLAWCDAASHGLHHSVTRSDALVVTVTYAHGGPFSFKDYEVFRPGETVPFQVGQTDSLGRLSFLPDREGDWRVRAFSRDGHGLDVVIPSAAAPPPTPPAATPPTHTHTSDAAPPGPLIRIAMGVSILFGVFGVVTLFYRKRP
jgi:nickel transport protein